MTNKDPVIDLSRLPPPSVVADWSVEETLQLMKDRYTELMQEDDSDFELSLADPNVKGFEVHAYLVAGTLQRVNDQVREVLLPYSQGSNLENLVSLGKVQRETVTQTGQMETDVMLRRKFLLSIDQRSTAGTAQAYVYHALDAAEGTLMDAHAYSPEESPGESFVRLLFHPGISQEEEAAAFARILRRLEVKKPLTDRLWVDRSRPVEKRLRVRLHAGVGVDPNVVKEEAVASLKRFLQTPFGPFAPDVPENFAQDLSFPYAVGRNLYLSAIHAALTVDTVYRVETLERPEAPDPETSIVSEAPGDGEAQNIVGDIEVADDEHLVVTFNPAEDILVGPPFAEQP